MSVTSATSRMPIALSLIVLNAWMLWRQLRQQNYWRAGGLVVVIAILAAWIWPSPSVFESFRTYAPKAWKEVNYDRIVATIGAAVPVIQFLFDLRKREPPLDRNSDDDENRRDMLEAVRRRVDELLEKTVNKDSEFGLGFVEVPEALIRLEEWSRVPSHPPTTVPVGTPVLSIFEKFGRHLLILGAPGAGKTTLLRKLARALVEQAYKDRHDRIPVIFELTTWTTERQPLTDWMIERLRQSYRVPRNVAEDWVQRTQILPLLDGLDEVPPACREACVDTINQFRHQHGFVPVVVCCRVKDYESIGQKLELDGAVAIQPLARADVEDYLQQLSQPLEGLRQMLVRAHRLSAAFHAAQALIFEHGDKAVKTHKGVRTEFLRLTKNDARIDPELHAFLGRAYNLKAIADYVTGPGSQIGPVLKQRTCLGAKSRKRAPAKRPRLRAGS